MKETVKTGMGWGAWRRAAGWGIALLVLHAGGGRAVHAATAAPAPSDAEALVADADGAARAGQARKAWALFGRAWSVAPNSPLPPRGICRLALALGVRNDEQQAAARSACRNALMLGGTPEDMRNMAAALASAAGRPSMDDLVEASFAADGALRTGAGQVWGPRALGDLALQLSDRELLDAAVSESRRVAPDHPQTKALIALASAHASPGVWAGRLAVLITLLLTAGHALLAARLTRRRRRFAAPLAVVLALPLLFGARTAAAAIDDAHPEASVPSPADQLANPLAFADLLTDLAARAEAASKRGDHAAAARYYAALAKAVPDRKFAFAKLCDALEANGQRAQALSACGAALTRAGVTAGDYTDFVRLLVAKNGPLTAEERRLANVALGALDSEPRAAAIATRVRCNIAFHDRDLPALEACTADLTAAEPDDARTIAFQKTLATARGGSWTMPTVPVTRPAARFDVRWAAAAALSFLALFFLYRTWARAFAWARWHWAAPRAGRSKT